MLHLVAAGAASRNETTASLPKALDQKWLERKREQKNRCSALSRTGALDDEPAARNAENGVQFGLAVSVFVRNGNLLRKAPRHKVSNSNRWRNENDDFRPASVIPRACQCWRGGGLGANLFCAGDC
jgi:hypothetical protein